MVDTGPSRAPRYLLGLRIESEQLADAPQRTDFGHGFSIVPKPHEPVELESLEALLTRGVGLLGALICREGGGKVSRRLLSDGFYRGFSMV